MEYGFLKIMGLLVIVVLLAVVGPRLGPFAPIASAVQGRAAQELVDDVSTLLPMPEQFVAGTPSASNFEFEVCNRSWEAADVAIGGRKFADSGQLYVTGWWTVGPGECKKLGQFLQGAFYAVALGESGNWQGSDLKLCVSNKRFERANYGGYTCGNNERLVGFTQINASGGKFVWNLRS